MFIRVEFGPTDRLQQTLEADERRVTGRPS
jgi:hypothetical protein